MKTIVETLQRIAEDKRGMDEPGKENQRYPAWEFGEWARKALLEYRGLPAQPEQEQREALKIICGVCNDSKIVWNGTEQIPCPSCGQPIPVTVDDRTDFEKQVDFKMTIGTGNPPGKVCSGIAIAVPAKTAALMAEVDDKNLLDLYRKFYAVWNRCESNRGCYSCAKLHDCRCEKEREISDRCTCGRDDLEVLESEIDKLELKRAKGEG